MLEVNNLCAKYKNNNVFSNISFTLQKNCITALCGANGCGKSTLLSLMAGLPPDFLSFTGSIKLNEAEIFSLKPKQKAQQIAFLVQNEQNIWDVTVKDLISQGLYAHQNWYENDNAHNSLVSEVAERLFLSSLINRSIFSLSGGELQRVRIARALVQKTPYIFLDEPLTALDINFQKELLAILRQLCTEGKTVFLSIHDINLASQCAENLVLLKSDRSGMFYGKTQDLIKTEILKEAFNTDFQVFNHPISQKKQIY